MHIRASEHFQMTTWYSFDANQSFTLPTVEFMGLNAVRALSLVSLILVFSSTILVMVTNIKAVNTFDANQGNSTSTMVDCDYIE